MELAVSFRDGHRAKRIPGYFYRRNEPTLVD